MKAVSKNLSINPELPEFSQADARVGAQIAADVDFLKEAIRVAPVGDPSEEEMAAIYASIKARRIK